MRVGDCRNRSCRIRWKAPLSNDRPLPKGRAPRLQPKATRPVTLNAVSPLQGGWGDQDRVMGISDPKTCRRCQEEKPLREFGRDRRNRDGLRTYCHSCRRGRARLRRRQARGVTDTPENSTTVTPRAPAANSGPASGSVAYPAPVTAGPWPQPLDPKRHPPELVERRLLVLEVYRQLDQRFEGSKGAERAETGAAEGAAEENPRE